MISRYGKSTALKFRLASYRNAGRRFAAGRARSIAIASGRREQVHLPKTRIPDRLLR